MRRIGALDNESQARQFSAYLNGLGVQHNVKLYRTDFEFWIHDEAQLDQARSRLEQFRYNPQDPQWQRGVDGARRQPVGIHPRRVRQPGKAIPLTLGLLVVCALIYLSTQIPSLGRLIYGAMQIDQSRIANGEVWRLVTPVLLHFSTLHIVFNMLWWYILGRVIETQESALLLMVQTVIIGMGSNVAQYYVAGPNFGGMSGVIYGLLGYVWMRAQYDPRSGYYIDAPVVVMMLAWLVICFTGLVGPVANTAHVSGLLLGIVWGLLHAHLSRLRRG